MKCNICVLTLDVVIDIEKEVSDAFLTKWLDYACKDYTTYKGIAGNSIRITGITSDWLHDFVKALEAL